MFWPLHSMLLFMMLISLFPIYWRISYFIMFTTSSSCCPLQDKWRAADGWVNGYERYRAVMRCTPSLWEMTLSAPCSSVAALLFPRKGILGIMKVLLLFLLTHTKPQRNASSVFNFVVVRIPVCEVCIFPPTWNAITIAISCKAIDPNYMQWQRQHSYVHFK